MISGLSMRMLRASHATWSMLLLVWGFPTALRGFMWGPSVLQQGVRLSGICSEKSRFGLLDKRQFTRAKISQATRTGSESGTHRLDTTTQVKPDAKSFDKMQTARSVKSGGEESGDVAAAERKNDGLPTPFLPLDSHATTSTPEVAVVTSSPPEYSKGNALDLGDGFMEEKTGAQDGGDAFDAEQLMDNMLDKLKGAAEVVTPVFRGADGRLAIDGNGLLNLCILVTAGLWTVHSILTVDASIWRGWTLQETLIRMPYDNWDSYETGLAEHPIITKTAINVVIYLLGDWLSQVNWGRDADRQLWEFDLQRTLRNGLIAAFFGPIVHYYYNFSDSLLPPEVPINRPFKIAMDQTLFFISKVAAYLALVSLLRGDPPETIKTTVVERTPKVVRTGWRFWPFVHVVTYFVIPPRHRVLWVNCVDLIWSSVLAGMASGTRIPGGGSNGGDVDENNTENNGEASPSTTS